MTVIEFEHLIFNLDNWKRVGCEVGEGEAGIGCDEVLMLFGQGRSYRA
jgi:hypothetical protein